MRPLHQRREGHLRTPRVLGMRAHSTYGCSAHHGCSAHQGRQSSAHVAWLGCGASGVASTGERGGLAAMARDMEATDAR